MYRLVDKIRFWDRNAPVGGGKIVADSLEVAALSCSDETVDYTMCHLCAYDPILGVVICVGDNVPVVVLVRGRRRVSLTVRSGVHWIQCFIFAGTSAFLLLSPECLLLLDYARRSSSSALFPRGREGELFSCLHVPQGVTWGVVGCRNGSTMYWRLREEGGKVSLVWVELTTDLLGFCRLFLPTPTSSFCGHIRMIDSCSTYPNSLVAVLSGVPGVCKWQVEENRLKTFFSAPATVPNTEIAVCRMTPGGAYIVATTFDVSVVFVWSDSGKKSKCVEPMWVVETGCCPAPVVQGTRPWDGMGGTPQNFPCGIHITRSAGNSARVQSDKKCCMHLLLHSDKELVELVVDLGKKRLIQREDVLANVAAVRLPSVPVLEAKEALVIQGVIPCTRSNYWLVSWSDVDIDTLLLVSLANSPLLIQRCRQKRSVECVTELEDLPRGGAVWSEMVLLAPSAELTGVVRTAMGTSKGSKEDDPWNLILGGDEPVNMCGVEKQDDPIFLCVESNKLLHGVCLFPLTNECVPIPWSVAKQDATRLHCDYSENTVQRVILEQTLPETPRTTEFIVRVLVDDKSVSVYAIRLWPQHLERLMLLSKECLTPAADPASVSTDDDVDVRDVVQKAILVECRIEKIEGLPLPFQLVRSGRCILMQLWDASLVLVDMSSGTKGLPAMVHYPSGLFPAGTSVVSFDTAWVKWGSSSDGQKVGQGNEERLVLFCTLSDQKGVVVWDMCRMRLLTFFPQTESGRWRYNTVMTFEQETSLSTVDKADGLVIYISRSNICATIVGARGAVQIENEENQEEGHLFLRDVFGRLVASLCVCHRLDGSGSWCMKESGGESDWNILSSADAMSVRFCVRVKGDEVLVTTDKEFCLGKVLVSSTHIAALDVDCHWPFSAPLWDLHEEGEGSERKEVNTSESPHNTATQCEEAAKVLLYNRSVVDFFPAAQLMSNGKDNVPAATCRFEPDRSIEHVVHCPTLHAVVVLTKDANRWRWLNVLDLDTARHMMKPYAMIHFSTQDDLCVYSFPVKGNGVHLYVMGCPVAVLAHLVLTPAGDDGGLCCEHWARGPLLCPQFPPAPTSFRVYGQYLPPQPTMKQEQSLLNRLMAPPWEEVVMKLEAEVLRKVQTESFDDFQRRLLGSAGVISPKGPREAHLTKKAGGVPLPLSRYEELKSTAARENVSLNEARRIMFENRTVLQERGERILEIESKTRELANEAATFEDLSRRLREKQQRGWL